ncbi:MAG: hypothetical protein COX78_00535, partial [Candidatus Levybacteria bacterium CG_4_10_14_0_2_um_filter_35_8]
MKNKGQSLIELLIVIALSAILIPALLVGFAVTRNGRAQQEQRLQATNYLKEAQEAIRIIYFNNWDNLINGTYHPVVSSSTWVLSPGSEAIDNNFVRQVTISDVFRDTNGNIVTIGGVLDPSTKEITVSVSWINPMSSSVTASSYLTRNKNLTHLETVVADFTPGVSNPVTTGVVITDTSGGEIMLGAGGGGGDWCNPSQSITTVNLSRQGIPTSVWAFEAGDGNDGNRVFAGTGLNASGPTFTNTKVIGNSPPTATFLGQFNNTKTNGMFGSANYAYLATDQNSAEVTILDLNQFTDPPTNQNYKTVGTFDTPGPTDANGVFVSGDTGYVITGSTLYNFNITDKTNPTALDSDGVTLAGTGNKIVAVGNYAYVVTSSTSKQLQIVDISIPTNLSVIGNLSSGLNDKGAVDLFVNSSATIAYVVTSVSDTNGEFFIIDMTNKTNPAPVVDGAYELGGMNPKGVTAVTGNKVIIVGTGGLK